MESTKPETLARTSTVSPAANRPVYSSHSVMTLCTGPATVTDGAGGAAVAAGLLSQPTSHDAAANRESNNNARSLALPPPHILKPISPTTSFILDQIIKYRSQ